MSIPSRIISFWHDQSTMPAQLVEAQAASREASGVAEYLVADDE